MELETINRLFLELSQFCTATTKRESELQSRVRELDDQLRWRKWPDEKPKVGQHYLLMAGAKAPTVAEFTGENFRFPSRIVDGVTHWRPIGPLPGGE